MKVTVAVYVAALYVRNWGSELTFLSLFVDTFLVLLFCLPMKLIAPTGRLFPGLPKPPQSVRSNILMNFALIVDTSADKRQITACP